MQKNNLNSLVTLGELVRRVRAESMDQQELGKRVGVSRSTISAIERGQGVNSKSLFKVLGFLGLLDVLLEPIDKELGFYRDGKVRKARKVREGLPNDF